MSHAPQTSDPTQGGTSAAARHVGHPGAKEYVVIAVILAVVTAIEVGVYYIQGQLGPVYKPMLAILSIGKFAMVAMFFMHLKFDSRFFSLVFVTGILVAVAVFVVFLSMIRVFFV
ncbi:MAG TPA: cytochrome C oxidase subunit IV family protein [Dehalococcoidia bacterium]|nr:cytochrome C oxidase subunit IV family protein [Dehalococcoidia bacterium]